MSSILSADSVSLARCLSSWQIHTSSNPGKGRPTLRHNHRWILRLSQHWQTPVSQARCCPNSQKSCFERCSPSGEIRDRFLASISIGRIPSPSKKLSKISVTIQCAGYGTSYPKPTATLVLQQHASQEHTEHVRACFFTWAHAIEAYQYPRAAVEHQSENVCKHFGALCSCLQWSRPPFTAAHEY